MAENFPHMLKSITPHIQEAQRTQNRRNKENHANGHHVTLMKTSETNSKASEEKKTKNDSTLPTKDSGEPFVNY